MVLRKIKIEDFREKTTPHFDSILRSAWRLTKNQIAAEALTTEVYLQAWKAFCFYKPEISCRTWLLKILFRQFNRRQQKIIGLELVGDDDKILKLADSSEIELNTDVYI